MLIEILHKAVLWVNRFKKYPNVRRSACIMPNVQMPRETVVGKWAQINSLTTIGKNVFIGRNVHICGFVTIGNNVVIGHLAHIVTNNAGLDGYNPITANETPERIKPVVIEDDVYIGGSAVISKGVRLGKGCIVMVGSAVFDNVPEHAVVQGNPAKIIGYIKNKTKGKYKQLEERYGIGIQR